VSPFESSFHILKNCDALVTLTGTVGWEAVLFGKVPIVMGYPYYTNLYDGIIHCPKVSGLSKAIDKAVSAKPVSKEHIKLFVASMIKNAFIFLLLIFGIMSHFPKKKLIN
jgi:capsule polysaccharide export protein KpsC/LpsZ